MEKKPQINLWFFFLKGLVRPADHTGLSRLKIISPLWTCLCSAEDPDHQQKHGCPYKGSDDLIEDAGGADGYMQYTEQPAADKGAYDTNDHGSDATSMDTTDEPFRQQTRNASDNDPDHN